MISRGGMGQLHAAFPHGGYKYVQECRIWVVKLQGSRFMLALAVTLSLTFTANSNTTFLSFFSQILAQL
jgi:hypothetical protein